ncbi:MAG: TRAP transporter substrate-binding protein DctP [Lautropia sp.]
MKSCRVGRTWAAGVGAWAAVLLSLSTNASAADASVTIRLADSLPAGHSFTKKLAEPFMAEVTKRSGGSISFQHFPASQLGKGGDLLKLLQSGVTEMALVVGPYVAEQMPLSGVIELPGGFSSSCQGAKALWTLAVGGLLETAEFKPNGIRMLGAIVQPPFQAFTSKPSLKSLKDMEGQKLRTTGGPMDLMARKIGAVPVRMAAPEVREAMSRGTIDGGILAIVSIDSYKLTPLVKAATLNENFGSAGLFYSISDKAWNKLSPAQQKIMTEVGREMTFDACAKVDADVAKDYEKMRAAGISVAPMDEASRKQIAHAAEEVGADWAKALDGRGKQGTAVLKAFREAIN